MAPARPAGGDATTSRLKNLAGILINIASTFPNHCTKSAKLHNPHPTIRAEFRSNLESHLCSFSASCLGGAVSAWRRYSSFLKRLPPPSPPPFPVDPAVLAVFLAHVGAGNKDTAQASATGKARGNVRGGGSGARAVQAGLVFLRDHLEMELPMDDPDVRSAGINAPIKRKGQATPASPGDLHALGEIASSPNKIASFFGLAVIVILRAGIRYEHSRRSTLQSFDAAGAWFLCAAGKSRKGGQKAEPFRFFVPEVIAGTGPFPTGCIARFCRRLRKAFGDKANFILPAIAPASASISSATKLRWEPMSIGAFNSNMWAISVFGLSLTKQDGTETKRTSYSLRRLGPTLAQVCKLFLHERIPLGNWTGACLAKEERAAARAAKMPLLYADGASKEEAEMAVKTAVWRLVDGMRGFVPSATWASPWSAYSPTFEECMMEWRSKAAPKCMTQMEQVPIEPPSRRSRTADSSSSSSSTSSSSSSSSSRVAVAGAESSGSNSDAWSIPESVDALEYTEFAHGTPSDYKVHFLTEDGDLPGCAHGVEVPPEGFGLGLADLRRRGRLVCHKCCRRFSTTPDALAARMRAEE